MERKWWTKKLMAVVMAVAMIFVAVPMVAMADHPRGNNGSDQRCNNTYRSYTHKSYVTNITGGAHVTSEGYTCYISNLVYEHGVYCTACGYYFGTETKACTTVHSKCGTTIVNH